MQALDALLSTVAPKRGGVIRRSQSKKADTHEEGRSTIRKRKWAGFRSVLCAIDFSEHSRQALRYAAMIAQRRHAALTVLYVNDPLLITAAAVGLHDRELAKRSAHELQKFVSAGLAGHSRTPLRVKSEVTIGDPSEEILKVAESRRTDLIVVGTHGLTGVDRLLMGSTTLSLLQRALVPVLAIPCGAVSTAAAVSPAWPGKRMIAAIDLDPALSDEVETAERIAQWFGASLLLVHVVSDITAPAWLAADVGAHHRIAIARAKRRMVDLARVAQRHVKTDVRVVCGNIADEMAAVVATEGAELLLTVLHDRRRWFSATRGSLSYHILTHAVTPVLACPPEWRPR